MKTLLTLSLFLSFTFPALAAKKKVVFCHTPRFFKSFVLSKDKVVFLKKSQNTKRREVASVPTMKNKKILNGFIKEVSFEGSKYKIAIKDKKNFSGLDDHLSIRNRKGHEMTYSLSCQRI